MNEDKLVKGIFASFGIFWVLSLLASLGVTVAIICVAWHFISKFW